MKGVIGIDTGTTHLKTALISEDGQVRLIEKDVTPLCTRGNESWYDPRQLYDLIKEQIRRLMCHERNWEISAICLTGMAEAGLVVDRNTGRELTEALPWFDKRSEECSRQLSEDQIRRQYRKTGLYNSYKHGIYKYAWLRENRNLKDASSIWLSISDYIAFRLTGRYFTTTEFAVRTYGYDMVQDCWDQELLERFGLKAENFPSVKKEGEVIGNCVDSELCAVLGNAVEVAISGHDHVCALYGIAGRDSTRIVDSCGTAETYMAITRKRLLTDKDFERGLVYGPYPEKDKWFWMGNIPSSGQSVEWFRRYSYDGKERKRLLTYEELELMLEKNQKEPTGLFYFPYLNGVGTPVYRGDLKPQLVGKRENQTESVILKAIIEGVQYQGVWIMECAGCTEDEKMQLWCVGGAVKSNQWMKLKADILGMPVYVPRMEEATLLGAAAVYFNRNHKKGFPEGVSKVYLPEDGKQESYRKLAEEYQYRAKEICSL